MIALESPLISRKDLDFCVHSTQPLDHQPVRRGAKIQQTIGPQEDLLTIVKRRKLQWHGRVSRSSGLARTNLQGTVKGGRRQGRQRKRREDNIREWTGLEFGKSQKAVENREIMEKTGCKIICDVPTTLAVKELMLMMMRDGEIGVSGIFISKTYSLHCHHQNNSALRWEAVCAILMFH